MGRLGLNSFVQNNTGKRLANPVTGSYPGQCVSLVQQYLDQCLDISYTPRGDAKDWIRTIPAAGLGRISGEQPKFGELVVWAKEGGGYGHIGVSLGNGKVFNQNDGFGGHNGTARVIDMSIIKTPYTTITMNKKPSDMPTTGGGLIGKWNDSSNFGGRYILNVDALNVRSAPKIDPSNVEATYIKNKNDFDNIINLEGKYMDDGTYIWGTYVNGKGERRYIAVGPKTGGIDANRDYLLKV